MQSVTMETSDLVRLQTRTFEPAHPASKKAIVLVHRASTIFPWLKTEMWTIAGALAERGYRVVTYERRRIGDHACERFRDCDAGDIITVCRWVSDTFAPHGIVLVGYSFVAPLVGKAAASIERLVGFVSISYPFGSTNRDYFGKRCDEAIILRLDIPRLFIMGTNDWFTTVEELRAKLESASGHVETLLLDGVGSNQLHGPAIDPPMADLIARFVGSLPAWRNPRGTPEPASSAESTTAATADTAESAD